MHLDVRRAIFHACMSSRSPVAALRRLAIPPLGATEIARSTMALMINGHREFLGNDVEKEIENLPPALRSLVRCKKSWVEFADEHALLRVVKFCLKNGVLADDQVQENTLMLTAAASNRSSLVALLLDHGANPDGPTGIGPYTKPVFSALGWAKKNDSWDTFLLLLARGANPNCPGFPGSSVLVDVVCSNRLDLADILVSRGANPLLVDDNGESLFHEWIANGADLVDDTAHWILKSGVDPHHKNHQGDDAFDFCRMYLSQKLGADMVENLRHIVSDREAITLDQNSPAARRQVASKRL